MDTLLAALGDEVVDVDEGTVTISTASAANS